jgi:alpha-amylase/alpha-mannosidase (GH57 family)
VTIQHICIHGHFYQPPRENPWLEEVEFQESAKPYHDWNERITAECYAPNAVSRIMDSKGRIIGLLNNYSRISFNFGPTLLSWLEKRNPRVYESILNADKESINSFSGHGSAIAQVFNHMIMPLANRKDKETQVKWAIRDFEKRFSRFPEGMWLPETAVDNETLEVLAENNIKFTILSPHQANKIRKIGAEEWIDVANSKVDPRRAYLCKLSSGKTITLFFFDKRTASDIAFGNLLENGEAFAKRLIDSFKDSPDEQLIESVASDGELYGHHHPHGDMTLAYCLYYIDANELGKVTNYAEFLEKNPAKYEVLIQENTSWSCLHGIERWRSDCGCNMHKKDWKQVWRRPLREAMDWLRDTISSNFEKEAIQYLNDPWAARNDYINVILDRSRKKTDEFLVRQAKKELNEAEKRRVVKLLEMQRHAMLMYTSCGWFFDEISGIETVQVMMYAARAMQLAHEIFGLDLENDYLRIIQNAPSNISEFQNGAKIYTIFVKPAIVDFAKISAQYTMTALFTDAKSPYPLVGESSNGSFNVSLSNVERRDFYGRSRLIVSNVKVSSNITLDEQDFGCAAIWLGDHNVSSGAMPIIKQETFNSVRAEILSFFEKGQINEIIVTLNKNFGQKHYSLKDLFKDDQRFILNYILDESLRKAKELFNIIYRDNSALLRFMKEARIPSPKSLQSAAEIVFNMQIEQLLSAQELDLDHLENLISYSKDFSVSFDSETLSFQATEKISREFGQLINSPKDIEKIRRISRLIKTINELPVNLNLWRSQNIAFEIGENLYREMKERNDEFSKLWILAFTELCELIGIRLD